MKNFLAAQERELKLAATAVLDFRSPAFIQALEKLRNQYSPLCLKDWPPYLRASAAARQNPHLPFPWAQTAIFVAIPFRLLPPQAGFLPLTDDSNVSGLVAGYGARLDYHLYGRQILAKIAENLKAETGKPFRSEACVDTRPLAEKSLAAAAGLGRLGRNTCLLCNHEGSGCFLAVLLLDLNLPNLGEDEIPDSCINCDQCRQSCPNRVLEKAPAEFACSACRSYLTMEAKGELNDGQRRNLGEWLFGCDLCTAACPASQLPEAVKVDLAWLLAAPAAVVRKAIKNTPLEYAGVTRLKRNALYILANKPSASGRKIISQMANTSTSKLLTNIARKLSWR